MTYQIARFGPGARVAVMVPAPFDGALDYVVPEGLELGAGDFVQVELGARLVTGIVWGAATGEIAIERLKRIAGRFDVPPMADAMRRFLDRAAEYTLTPPGMMVRMATRVPDLGKPAPSRRVWSLTDQRPERMTPARQRVIEVLEA
ncbi:MAG: primosomal protein N', partial [Pseudomonadota bacterium]